MTLKNRLFLPIFLLLASLEALLALAGMLTTPSDPQTARLLGLSASRLALAGFLSLAAGSGLVLAFKTWRQPAASLAWLELHLLAPRRVWLTALGSGLVFLAAGAFLAIPTENLGQLWAIEARLRPLTLWLLLFSLQSLAALVSWQSHRQNPAPRWKNLLPAALILSLCLAIWALIDLTKLGLTSENSFWSKVGVPLLWPQIFLGLGLALLAQRYLFRNRPQLWLDLALGLLLWGAAVLLWSGQSFSPGVFNTPARPPTQAIYPINDSFIFDVAAQKMLTGWPLPSEVQDKPLYIAYLALLHALAGDSYSLFYLYQIFSLAFIPILGYLLGKQLHSRSLGLFFALLLILKEQNAIALTNYIHVSSAKMILSEPLTTLGLLLFSLSLIAWLKDPRHNQPHLWLAGGWLGLTSLVRLNAMGVLVTALLLVGLALRFKLKPWVWAATLFSLFLLLSALPWLTRSAIISGDPLNFIRSKTEGVVLKERYQPLIETTAPPSTPASPNPANPLDRYWILGQGLVNNYLHNLLGVTLMLPPTLKLYSLTELTRLPYWSTDWDGSLLPGDFWVLLGVLALSAYGLGRAWQHWRAAGLVPLAVLLGYNLTTAISLTSGGRYLVPFDWVVLFYFAWGLFEASLWLLGLFGWPLLAAEPTSHRQPTPRPRGLALTLVSLGLLGLGSLPILFETLPPTRYPHPINAEAFFSANASLPELSAPGVSASLSSLASDPLARVGLGRALYPRYYPENKGDDLSLATDPLIGAAPYDRLTFLLIGSKLVQPVNLPYSGKISPSVAGAETWVLGCQRGNYLEAVVVVFRAGETVKVYQQETIQPNCQ